MPVDISKLQFWECRECGFDAITVPLAVTPVCPICAGDTGRDGDMNCRPVRADDGPVEGKDARKDQQP